MGIELLKVCASRLAPRLLVPLLALAGQLANSAAVADCQPSGGFNYLCGPQSAEDLVAIPDTQFILASGYSGSAPLYLIDADKKTWTRLDFADNRQSNEISAPYADCPGLPERTGLVTHGLTVRPGVQGHATLYAVGHGPREAIEIFDVDANGATPALTWIGCVMLPEGLAANSVASLQDGSLIVTVPLHGDKTIVDAMTPEATGAVYRWSPGSAGFTLVAGTELPYPNGIEVSADEREFYVASSGLFTVVAFSNTNPARRLRTTEAMDFVPDNLHRGDDGRLITAGLLAVDEQCGNVRGPEVFDLAAFATCPRPFIVKIIDGSTMRGEDLVTGPADKLFSNITMALTLGDEIWIGTFAGDRIAYRVLGGDD